MNRSRLFLLCLVLTVLSALAVAPHQQKGNKVLCYELQYAIDDYGNRIDHSNVHVFSRDFKKYNPIDVFGARDVYRLVRVSKSQVK